MEKAPRHVRPNLHFLRQPRSGWSPPSAVHAENQRHLDCTDEWMGKRLFGKCAPANNALIFSDSMNVISLEVSKRQKTMTERAGPSSSTIYPTKSTIALSADGTSGPN
ncbi:hypothetical protein B9Z55_025986 [Caenorhabditis nigoni]|uniref:Uncharacterized protein n=1 Tax=Caenorhabditis nigoni TaxID=1611254 RepID=A0A2G5T191_9PELO|nr:hypothetical protein B9Z55_025986 [Caenorhabditis nigoni]